MSQTIKNVTNPLSYGKISVEFGKLKFLEMETNINYGKNVVKRTTSSNEVKIQELYPLGVFVKQYLTSELKQQDVAEACNFSVSQFSKVINHGAGIDSSEGRNTILRIVMVLQNHHNNLRKQDVNELLISLKKAPLNPEFSEDETLINVLSDESVSQEHVAAKDVVYREKVVRKNQNFAVVNSLQIVFVIGILLILSFVLFQSRLSESASFTVIPTSTPVRKHETPLLIGYGASNPQAFIQYYEVIGGSGLVGMPIIGESEGTVVSMNICDQMMELQELQGCDWCKPFALVWNSQTKEVYNIHGSIMNYFMESEDNQAQLCMPIADQKPAFNQQPLESVYGRKGFSQEFESGRAFVSDLDGWKVRIVQGEILDIYLETEGIEGPYGFPISDEIDGVQRFENGVIALDGDYTEAEWVEQSPSPVQITSKTSESVTVGLRNAGNRNWDENLTIRVAEPAYDAEKFACPNWIDPTTATRLTDVVVPGEIAVFNIELCPSKELPEGEYTPNWVLYYGDKPVPNFRNGNADNLASVWWNVQVREP